MCGKVPICINKVNLQYEVLWPNTFSWTWDESSQVMKYLTCGLCDQLSWSSFHGKVQFVLLAAITFIGRTASSAWWCSNGIFEWCFSGSWLFHMSGS